MVAFADKEAAKNHINAAHFKAVISCESQWNITAEGDNHTSFGLMQIHLPAHPEITKEEAEDPLFAIPWGAEQYAKDPTIWTCERLLSRRNWK